MKTITTLAVTVLLGSQATTLNAAAQLAAQAESRVEARGQSSAPADVQAVVRATAEAGLPTAPVRRTVAEGEAKGAAQADVVRAALRTHSRLMVARDALASDGEREPSQGEIELAAEALLRGADRADLERLAAAAPEGRSLEASLQTMLSLGSQGQTPSQISSSIAAQLAAGASVGTALGGSASGGISAATGALQVAGGLSGALGVIVP